MSDTISDTAASAASGLSPSEGRRIVRRVLKRRNLAGLLGVSDTSFSVTDLDGKTLLGRPPYDGEPKAPVLHGEAPLALVSGIDADRIAALLSVLVEQAIEARALATESLEKYKELTMLYALSDRLFTLTEVGEIGQMICEETGKIAPASGIAVLILNEETGLLEVVASAGETFGEKTSIPVSDDLIGAVLSSGRGEIVNDLRGGARRMDVETDFAAAICVPLKARDRIFGVVVIGNSARTDYSAGDLQLSSALASQAASAIEVARLNKVLVAQAGKPAEIIFGANDLPPRTTSAILGFQHALIALMSIVTPIIITTAAGGTRADAASVIAMSLVAIAIATFALSYFRPPFGAGFPLIPITSVIFLAPSLIAAQSGGLGLVFGMTIFSGACVVVFSQIISRFRRIFPPEISGVVVLMVGLSMIRFALPPLVGIDGDDQEIELNEILVGLGTLALIILLTVTSFARLRLFSTIIGVTAGTIAFGLFVGFDPDEVASVLAMPVVGLPRPLDFTLSFDVLLVIPFIAAAMAAAVKDAGLITSLQKSNDRSWKRPETRSIGAGIMVDGVGSMLSGCIGGVGINVSAGNVGLNIATGALSRIIGVAAAFFILIVAFMPILVGMLALMPAPVIGAGLIYTACFLIGSGIQLVQSRMLDARRTFTIGLAIIGGIGVEVVDLDLSEAPAWVELILGNSLAFATFLAVTLNILLSFGVSSTARLQLALSGSIRERILQFVERNGALWGARIDVVHRAAPAVTEWCEELRSITACETVHLDMRFDEFSLSILVAPAETSAAKETSDRPTTLLRTVAGHIQSRYDAKVSVTEDEGLPSARLDFIH